MGKGNKTKDQLIDELEKARKEIKGLNSKARKYEKIEGELTHSVYFYQTLFENSGTATIVIEKDTTISMMNNDFANFTGYSREEIIGHTWTRYVAEDDIDRLLSFHRTRRENSSAAPRNYEFKIIRKDGHLLHIFMTITMIPGTTQSIASMVDITERAKMEKALRDGEEKFCRSEEKYRLLADHMKDQVWTMDLNLKVSYVSPSVEKSIGYTFDELKELPLDKLLTSESLQTAMNFLSEEMPKALAAPLDYILTRSLELEFRCKDGHTVWGESMFSFIRDKDGNPLFILGETREITERKQMESDLRASEFNFHQSLDDSPLGVRISTIEGKTLYANRAILDIYGLDNVDELENTPMQERYTPETYAEFKIRKAKRLRGESGPSEYEVGIMRKNGEIRHLYVFRKEIFWNGKKQFQVIYQDITLRRQAEEKLSRTLENLRQSIKATIQVLGLASEARDPYTAGHQKRVADLARAIAKEIGLSGDIIEGIRLASSIHDLGKLSIPGEILSKSTKLTDLEFSLVKEHSQRGYELLKYVESPWPLAEIVYQHHERINGLGYPKNLKGDEILIEARIMAVADVVEAMSSHRPYRAALGIEAALKEIEKNRGILYDKDVVDACLGLFLEKGYQLT